MVDDGETSPGCCTDGGIHHLDVVLMVGYGETSPGFCTDGG